MSDRAAKVNFYHKWLGIECRSRPDHYQLLGLARFESDEQRILAGFDQRRRKLRETTPGQFEPQWRKLADELIAAKRCLLTPAAKLAYDEHLRFRESEKASKAPAAGRDGALGKAPGATAESLVQRATSPRAAESRNAADDDLPELPPTADGLAAPSMPPSGESLPTQAVEEPIVAARPAGADMIQVARRGNNSSGTQPSPTSGAAMDKLRRDGRRARRNLAVWSVLLVAVVGGGLAMVLQMNQVPTPQVSKSADAATNSDPPAANDGVDSENDPAQPPRAAPKESSEPPSAPPSTAPPVEESKPAAEMRPAPPSDPKAMPQPTPTEKPEEEPAPEQIKQFRAALRSIRAALSDRDVASAEAELDVASALARGESQQRQVKLFRKLIADVSHFWRAVGEAASKINGGEELASDGRPFAIVVESSSTKFVIKADGRNHTYAIPAELTAELAELLARRSLKGQPDENRLLGAFQAVDRLGDLDQAAKHWQSEGPDASALLEVLRSEASTADD